MTRVWLIRHGEPAEQVTGRCYGSLDIELSAKGRHQMEEVAQHLKAESPSAIYTSPSSRALESARILTTTQSCPLETITDFREMDFGALEGLAYDEIAAQYPNLYRQWMETPTEIRFPNGENFSEMQTRVLRAFEKMLGEREGQTVMIVSHGGVNRILIAWALQMPVASIFRLAQDYAAVNLISFTGETPCLQLLNYRAPFL
jgi:alpha-ribazole phosphatase/probable phosphoglycerate mutase